MQRYIVLKSIKITVFKIIDKYINNKSTTSRKAVLASLFERPLSGNGNKPKYLQKHNTNNISIMNT